MEINDTSSLNDLTNFFTEIAKKTFRRVALEHSKSNRADMICLPRFYYSALDKYIAKYCLEISEALKNKKEIIAMDKNSIATVNKLPNNVRLVKEIKRQIIEEQKLKSELYRKETRRKLAIEIKDAKVKLKKLRRSIEEESSYLGSLTERCQILLDKYNNDCNLNNWPNIPKPHLIPSKYGFPDLLDVAGIYFIWVDNIIVYIGQSISLGSRLKSNSHHQIKDENEMISIIEMERNQLTWAENYYIGICRPMRNYGKRGQHNKDFATENQS